MRGGWHAWRLESHGTHVGIPDVYFISTRGPAWLELKVCRAVRIDVNASLPHFTPEQREFLSTQLRLGVRAFLLIRVLENGCHYLIQSEEGIRKAGRVGVFDLSLLSVWQDKSLNKIKEWLL